MVTTSEAGTFKRWRPHGHGRHCGRGRRTEWQLLYANLKEIVYHLARDADGQFHFVSANRAFFDTTGLRRDQVVGKLVQEVIPEESWSLAREHFREAIARRATVHWEEVTHYPAGKKVGDVSVSPVFDAAGECTDLVGTVHDITALKATEEVLRLVNRQLEGALDDQARLDADLRASEERLSIALESAGKGVWDWDLRQEQLIVSPRGRAILGLVGDTPRTAAFWRSLVHPDDVAGSRAFVDDFLSSGEGVRVHEQRVRHSSGRYLWIRARGRVVARDTEGRPLRVVGTLIDVTEERALRQELQRTHELFTKLTQQVPGALFEILMGADGRLSCSFISSMASDMFEFSPEQIERDIQYLRSRIVRADLARIARRLRLAARDLAPWHVEYRVLLPNKGLRWHELNARPTRGPDGVIAWHGFTADISERKRIEHTIRQFNERLEQRAHYDALTGLPNRVLFRDRLEQEMKHARGAPHRIALLFIDLDRFKEVNDLLGHDAGDALLVQAARRIVACVGGVDTVARLGGDEFTVILADTSELEHIELAAEHILDVLRMPFQLGIEQAYVSASIGIALYPGDARAPEDLMRNADQAMYRAKSGGRNQLTFFEPAMQVAAMHRLKLTSDLRGALAEDQFELFFQPILPAGAGPVHKAEALLRWRRAGDLVLPSEFIEIAEETGLIHEIGDWVFRQAVQWSRRWSAMLGRQFQISINKSPVQFQPHADSLDWSRHLADCKLPHNSIAVEITEGVLLNVSDAVFDRLHALQHGGMEVSIDDFGTGYSSMTYLKRLDIDYLKIDRSFVAEMMHDRTSATITETIIVMAHKLGLKVIAEGVESAAQRDWLAERHCDYLQGFLFGQPLCAAAFEVSLLRSHADGTPR